MKNWEMGSIVTVQSGLPFTPSIATDPANTGTSRRPDRIGSGTWRTRTLLRDFDVGAFRVPQAFTYGNSGRNILYGRGFQELGLHCGEELPGARATRVAVPRASSSTSQIHRLLAGRSLIFRPATRGRFSLPASRGPSSWP